MARASFAVVLALALSLGIAVPQPWTSPARAEQPSPSAAALNACGLEPGPTRAVTEVLDGDTARLDDGKVVKLAAILAPRAFDVGAPRGSWPPETAARASMEALTRGQSVALAFAGPRTDRHERVIAHLVVTQDRKQTWVQQALVAMGHARVHAAPGASACLAPLLEAEAKARGHGRGLWSHAAYQLRPAERPTELLRYAGSYQLVTGTIAKVTGSRALSILELQSSEPPPIEGSGRRPQRFRIVWKRAAVTLQSLPDARSLEGTQVLVRGWIESRGSPEIELLAPEQFEVQATAAPSEAMNEIGPRRRSRRAAGSDQGAGIRQDGTGREKTESPAVVPPGSKE